MHALVEAHRLRGGQGALSEIVVILVSDLWFLVYGVWCLFSGLRFLVSGLGFCGEGTNSLHSFLSWSPGSSGIGTAISAGAEAVHALVEAHRLRGGQGAHALS